MWFAVNYMGRAIPVGADHPQRLTLEQAAKVSRQDPSDMAEAWRESVGRWWVMEWKAEAEDVTRPGDERMRFKVEGGRVVAVNARTAGAVTLEVAVAMLHKPQSVIRAELRQLWQAGRAGQGDRDAA